MSKDIYDTFQKHHITPKCLLKHKSEEFIDHPSNITRLRYDHHIAVHKWLFMLTGSSILESTYNAMKTGKFIITNRSREHCVNISNSLKGHCVSSSTRNKISDSLKGSKQSIYTCKLRSISLQGNSNAKSKTWIIHGKMFYSSKLAGIFFNVDPKTIFNWCNNKVPHCYCI